MISPARALKNLTSIAATPCIPWEFTSGVISERIRADKDARHRWMTNPQTEHQAYALIEGLNPNGRIQKPSGTSEGNPAHTMHGFVADYDVPVSDDALQEGVIRAPYLPNYYEKSLSGNVRLVWLFESPIIFPSHDFAVSFLKFMLDEFGFEKIAPGLDKPAFIEPGRYYTNSCEWYNVGNANIPGAAVLGWLRRVSASFNWVDKEFGDAMPLDTVAATLRERYPKFADWEGEFTLGASGPSFWLDGSVSPKSAIVRESGIQTFAAHASKAFYSWADLLGSNFTTTEKTKQLGRAVEGIHYDGKSYWWETTMGWFGYTRGDADDHLKVARGVSGKPDKTGVSDVARALDYIRDHQRVKGAFPFVYRPAGIIRVNDCPILNISTVRTLSPAADPGIWGPEGNFPWISKLIDHLFTFEGSQELQQEFFLSWTARSYDGAYHQKPDKGHHIFIAGPGNVGKTLINDGILRALFGGTADAEKFLSGEENFGSEVFHVGFWAVDDASTAVDKRTKQHFAEILKKTAANSTFRYHAKFQIPGQVDWPGRVSVTCNVDGSSVQILPSLENTIKDKLMMFRVNPIPLEFLPRHEMEKIMARELPYFARYLLDYAIPEVCKANSRFGLKEFHDKTLVRIAEQSGYLSGFQQVLHAWRKLYFECHSEPYFEGTSLALQLSILQLCPEMLSAMKPYTLNVIGTTLWALKNSGSNIEVVDDEDVQIWRIFPESKKGARDIAPRVDKNLDGNEKLTGANNGHSRFHK